ncbi:unnamed protein product [Trichobilharzia szidati]|nr:unnamed protein product [Trichobilharzia szidati]
MVPDPIQRQLDKLTPYAAAVVNRSYERIRKLRHELDHLVDTSAGVCTCHHFHDYRLPCSHVLYAYYKGLFTGDILQYSRRWCREYNLNISMKTMQRVNITAEIHKPSSR